MNAVFGKSVLRQKGIHCFSILLHLVVVLLQLVETRVTLHVRVYYEGCQGVVFFCVGFVSDHRKDVKAGKNGVGQVNIVVEVFGNIVDAAYRVGSSDDRTTSLKGSDDTGFGD